MLFITAFRAVIIIFSTISCALAFSSQTSRVCRVRHHQNILLSQIFNSRIVRKAADSEEDGDDGWGESVSETTTTSISSSFDRTLKNQELADLQNELELKQQNKDSRNSSPTDRIMSEERDLFIPIFALVSVIGFTGIYGYEMLRLYIRGELYLPWN